jgi:hypothetical protein
MAQAHSSEGRRPVSERLNLFSVLREAVPADALLKTYRGGLSPERWGGSGDCFSVTAGRTVDLAEFVFAFYTSRVFRIERWLLRAFIGARSSDQDAQGLADGSKASFAAWYVGDRTATQLLMCDRYERTRSWFRVVPMSGGTTVLQFGSAVAAAHGGAAQAQRRGRGWRLMLRFHVLYSQVLLHAAKTRLMTMD